MARIAVGFSVPDEQSLKYTVTPLPGRLMSLRAVGGQLEALAKLIKACAREDDCKSKMDAFLLNIETSSEGEISFQVLIAERLKEGGAMRPAPERMQEIVSRIGELSP